MKKILFFSSIFIAVILSPNPIIAQPRTIVTSDGEVDDMDSFIRLLLCSNDLNIAGLVYSSSEFHYSGDGKGTTFTSRMPFAKSYGTRTTLRWLGTEWMQSYIDKYSTVYDNLVKHDKRYPSPEHLKSLIRIGNIDFEGEMDHNTDGSNYIKNILLDDNPLPVYIQLWGGTNTVARALKSIEEENKDKAEWKAIYKKVSDKLTLYIILDQDETYKNYVARNWSEVKVIYNSRQFWCLAYPWNKMVPKEYVGFLNGKWFKEHIKFNHGLLTSGYFLWGDGQKLSNDPDHTQGDSSETIKKGMNLFDFISEGDSPSYLYLLDVGLRNLENPSYGGWGGRFVRPDSSTNVWADGAGITDYNYLDKKDDSEFPQTRWVNTLQNDFAARADWCVKSVKEANHPPIVQLTGKKDIVSQAGKEVVLKVSARDPDGNDLTYKWWQYKEAGSYQGIIVVQHDNKSEASFVIPADAKTGNTIHIIAEVTDNGKPALTRYQRVIINIQ